MYEDINQKLKKKNQILFNRNSKCLQTLLRLIEKQKHKTIVLWSFECVLEPIKILEQVYPNEKRPRLALEKCILWAHGKIKMPVAKKYILDCHAFAKEINNKYHIALIHSVGQGVSSVHTETHAIGLVFYELTSIVINNPNNYINKLESKLNYYYKTLIKYQNSIDEIDFEFADFLNIDKENKEKMRNEKL